MGHLLKRIFNCLYNKITLDVIDKAVTFISARILPRTLLAVIIFISARILPSTLLAVIIFKHKLQTAIYLEWYPSGIPE